MERNGRDARPIVPIGTVGGRGLNEIMTTSPLVAATGLSEEQILERAAVCARVMRRAGAELLVLAYEGAVAHPVDRLDPRVAGSRGGSGPRSWVGRGCRR